MEVALLIWEVPLLIWLEVPLLIWWLGGKMNSRIRLTSAKIGVEVEAELGKNIHVFQFVIHYYLST